jgi:hypothetical protein
MQPRMLGNTLNVNTIQYNTIQYNTIQYFTASRRDVTADNDYIYVKTV